MSAGTAFAQQCLHGTGEAPEQAQRRREAIAAMRAVNTLQAAHAGSTGQYARHDELLATAEGQRMKTSANEIIRRIALDPSQDILPGWKLTLDVSQKGYWFMIKDTTDPCGYTYFTTQAGLIYTAQPLQ